MDIRLPNGQFLTGIPDGTSEEEIARVAELNGLMSAGEYAPTDSESSFFEGIPALGADTAQPEPIPQETPEDQSFFREVADVPIQLGKGATTGVRMISEAFGADNPIAESLRGVEDYLDSLLSAQSKQDSAEMGRILDEVKDKGIGDQVIGGLKALSVAPIDTLANAAGTIVPIAVGALVAPAAAAGGTALTLGTLMGAGVVKGTIHDVVYDEMREQGLSEELATSAADEAQSYGGENLDQIALGSVLGAWASRTGLEPMLARAVSSNVFKKAGEKAAQKGLTERMLTGAAVEAVPEAMQGGQEKLAENIALQREGVDVPTWRGVGSQATLEGTAGLILGGSMAGINTEVDPLLEKEAAIREKYQRQLDRDKAFISKHLADIGGYDLEPATDWNPFSVRDALIKKINEVDKGLGNKYLNLLNAWDDAKSNKDYARAENYQEAINSLEFEMQQQKVLPEMLFQQDPEDDPGVTMLDNILSGAYGPDLNLRTAVKRKPITEIGKEKYRRNFQPIVDAVDEALKKVGLDKHGVRASVVQRLEHVVQDEDGNYVFGVRPRKKGDEEKRSYDPYDQFVYADYIKEMGRAKGIFSLDLSSIFLSVEEAYKPGRSSQEIKERILSTLDHEKVHALKSLDLFTPKEWDVLIKASKKRIKQDGKTFYEEAQRLYKGDFEKNIEEEAVAELIRVDNEIAGTPRSLINRIVAFMKSIGESFHKNGISPRKFLNSLGDSYVDLKAEGVRGKIEAGKIGARDSAVRTPHYLGASGRLEEKFSTDPELNAKEQELAALSAKSFPTQEEEERIDQLTSELLDAQLEIDAMEQTAWHGSGAVFDRFKTDHIGEGEGMQVRGWGLYFGQQKKTGEHYYEMLGKENKVLMDGKPIKPAVLFADDAVAMAVDYLEDLEPQGITWIDYQTQMIDALEESRSGRNYWFKEQYDITEDNELIAELDRAHKLILDGTLKKSKASGALYKVDIPDSTIDAMLDLDDYIDNQTPTIQAVAKEVGLESNGIPGTQGYRLFGEDLRNHLEAMFQSQNMRDTGEAIIDDRGGRASPEESASKYLLSRGIPGNKFVDGWSRNKTPKIFYDGVDTDSKSFSHPKNLTVQEQMIVDGYLVELEQGETSLNKLIEYEAEQGYNNKILNFLKKIEIKQPKITQNYVVFDENDINILTRGGKRIEPKAQRRSPLSTSRRNEAATFDAPPAEYNTGKKILYALQDKLIGLKDIEATINEARANRGERRIAALDSAYIGEELSHDRIGEKAKDFVDNDVKQVVKMLSDAELELSDLDIFLVLRHAIERNERIAKVNPSSDMQDGGSGSLNGQRLTNQYVKDEMESRYGMTWDSDQKKWLGGNNRANTLKRIARKTDQIIEGTLDEAVEGQLITEADRDSLNSYYKYYTPLRGFGTDMMSEVAQEVRQGTVGSGGSMDIQGKQAGKATGRTSESFSPTATLISDRERTIARSVKNKDIGGRLFNLIKENPNPEVWELIGPDHPYFQNVFDSRYTYVGDDTSVGEKNVTRKTTLDDSDVKEDWVKQVKPRIMETVQDASGKELLGIKVNGEQYYVDIKDDNLRQALGNLNAQSGNWLIQSLGKVNRALSFVNTTLNPEFVIGNFSRDLETAIASIVNEQHMEGGMLEEINTDTKTLTKDVVKGLANSGKVFFQKARGDQNMNAEEEAQIDEFLNAGAKAGWFHAKNPEDQRANIQNMLDIANGTFKGKSINVMQETKKFVEDVNASVENAVRFSTFKVAKREFMDTGMEENEAIERAASMAKNMTINFNRKGAAGNTLNSLYLFFNAQVQGTAVVLRGVAGSPVKRKIMGSITAFGALMSMLHDWANDDDEDKGLEDIEGFVRERNMLVPGEIFGMEKDVKIPLPYGYNFFYQLGSNAYLMARGKQSPEKASVEMLNTMMGSFNPLGATSSDKISESLIKMGLPTAATPAAEISFNKNYFGSPIYKENMPFAAPEPASHRTRKNTNKVFKWLTQGVNELTGGNESESGLIDISPDTLSYLMGYGLGGAGKFFERSVMKPAGNITSGEAPFKEFNDVPFVRRLIHEYSDKPDMEMYYDRWDTIRQKKNHLENTSGRERSDYVQDNKIYFQFEQTFKQTNQQLRVLRQRQRQIQAAIEKYPNKAEELSENQQVIQDTIDKLVNRVNKLFDDMEKK